MTIACLERVTLRLPETSDGFNRRLASLLEPFGETDSRILKLTGSDPQGVPGLAIDFQSPRSAVSVDFLLADGETFAIDVKSPEGPYKKSPHSYRLLEIGTAVERFEAAGWKIRGIDHLGVNLPWLSPGIHPRILSLRESLAARGLYHRYPTGEPWDFILPGNPDEIAGRQVVDYRKVRSPKFELVSFDKASTPILQIDAGADGRYENFSRLFPEALADEAFRNIWIYLANPHAIDICLVLNEFGEQDWSEFFRGHRI